MNLTSGQISFTPIAITGDVQLDMYLNIGLVLGLVGYIINAVLRIIRASQDA